MRTSILALGLALGISAAVSGPLLAERNVEKSVHQTLCPVMGGKINKNVYADYQGKRVYFCCPGCVAKFKSDPAGYVKKLEEGGITLDKAPGK